MTAPVVVLSRADLEALLDAAISRARRIDDDEWMTADDVAALLGVKRSTIPTLVTRDHLPCYRPGKAYTFRRSEVITWLEARRSPRPNATLRALDGGRRDG